MSERVPTLEDFKLSQEEYEIIYPESVAASKALASMYDRLGRPDDPFSKAGEKMMDIIIAVWMDLYPEQVKPHYQKIKDYRDVEMSAKDQVKKSSGRSLASVPTPIYRMMRKIFPNFKMDHRDEWLELVSKYPMFQVTNKV